MAFLQTRQLYRCLTTGKISLSFIDILPQTLTIDSNYWTGKSIKYPKRNTLFCEVEVVPFEETITPEMQELFQTKEGSIQLSKSEFLSRVREQLMSTIEKYWNPAMNHIIIHSSGRDSRILSWLIRQVFKKKGLKWLEKIIFLCWEKEGPPFREIMQYEGWRKKQYLAVGENQPEEEVFAPIFLDFKNAWRRCNGTFTYAFNEFFYFPEVAHRQRGFPLENIQIWTGFFGDELAPNASKSNGGQRLKWMLEHLYYIPTYASRPMMGEVVNIFTDMDYLRLALRSSIRLGDSLRNDLLALLDPKLPKFRNMNLQGHGPVVMADYALKRAEQSYRKSWYGRKIRPFGTWGKIRGRYSPMSSYWLIASLCEHLITTGYKITKGS